MIKGFAALLVILAMVVGAIWGLVHIVGLQASLIWTAVIGAIAWATNFAVAQQKERRRLLAAEKREQYLQFLDFINETFGLAGEGPSPDMSPEKIRQLRRWSVHLTLIGSDDVVKAWNAARLSAVVDATGSAEMLRVWGGLWLAMRRDCGHHDTKLTVSEVLASIVNDVEQYREQLDRQDPSS